MTDEPGVYVLLSGGKPVYVGSSVRMRRRVSNHNHKGKFDSALYYPCSRASLQKNETKMIAKLWPPLNRAAPCRRNLPRIERTVRFNIEFSLDDMRIINLLKKRMASPEGGRVTIATVLRAAIRLAAAK
jgi:hypothetical protein